MIQPIDIPFHIWYTIIIIMKSSNNLLTQLETLPHFTKNTVRQLGDQLGLTSSSIDTYISRFLRRKEVFALKKGLYISADFFKKHKSDNSYQFYLANILRAPSYISSWAALQYYNLVIEATYGTTSVTPKVTRKYQTKTGTFTYQSIDKKLFTDFSLVSGTFDFFIASPAKALFDLLYFRTSQFRGLRLDQIQPRIEELRIDFDEMDEAEQKSFNRMIKENIRHEWNVTVYSQEKTW